LARGWPTAPIALPRVLGSLALRIETAGVGGRAVVHPLGAPAEWVAVGLRRVLVRLRMVVGVGCLHQLSGWWCGVGGRSGPRLFLLLGRRLLVSASVTVSAAGSRQGHLDTARSRSPGAALMGELIALEKLAFANHLSHSRARNNREQGGC
jgi:hypothetical protein